MNTKVKWAALLALGLMLLGCRKDEPKDNAKQNKTEVEETSLSGKAYANIAKEVETVRYRGMNIVFGDEGAKVYYARESYSLPYPPDFFFGFTTVRYSYDHKARTISFKQGDKHEQELEFKDVVGTTEGKGLERITIKWGVEPNVQTIVLHRIPMQEYATK
ncbi:MAG: hypothetical protein Q4A61_01660 [Porphyromonadaceae bacterium]|nr:hypothetical protein [Porphyromonadaceae bacterium]